MKTMSKQKKTTSHNLWANFKFKSRRSSLVKLWQFLLHPVVIFIFLQIAIIAAIVSWIIFYHNIQTHVAESFRAFGISKEFVAGQTLILSLSLGIAFISVILAGTILLFSFAVRQKMLNRQQKQFLSSVTHELKSPLASLQLCLETMLLHGLSEENRLRLIEMMQLDGQRLTRLVDQILVSSRLDRGINPDESESQVEASNFLEHAVQDATRGTKNESRRFSIECDVKKALHLPENAFKMVLVNILENALKYSPPGSPIVIRLQEQENSYLLSVKDQGYGIPKYEQKKIFRMFHRGAVSTERAIAGTGLGLFIARSVLRGLGGRMWVDSDGSGQGSTFFIRWRRPSRSRPSRSESNLSETIEKVRL